MEITEEQIRNEILIELASAKNGSLTTTQLIELLTIKLKPSGHDAEIAHERSDTYFSQKVRNTVSHRHQGTGLEARGLASYDDAYEGWTITPDGRAQVASFST